MVCGVWCVVCGVWFLVFGFWCVVCARVVGMRVCVWCVACCDVCACVFVYECRVINFANKGKPEAYNIEYKAKSQATHSVHDEKRVVSFIKAVRTNSLAICVVKELAKIFSNSITTSSSVTCFKENHKNYHDLFVYREITVKALFSPLSIKPPSL